MRYTIPERGNRILKFKLDVLPILKTRGITVAALREMTKFGSASVQRIRQKKICSMHELDVLCGLLGMQPGDLIEYSPDEEPEETE